MCHELGHLMFNLPDLYDTDQSSAGIGRWGLKAGGRWNFPVGDSWSGEKTASQDLTTNDSDETNLGYPLTCTGVATLPEVIHEHGFENSDAPGA